MRAAIPPLPNTPSWRGVQLKESATLPLSVSTLLDKLLIIDVLHSRNELNTI
jgi:hypothetical protein